MSPARRTEKGQRVGWIDMWNQWHPTLWQALKADVRHMRGKP